MCNNHWQEFTQNMMTSSNGNFPALLAICVENSPVPGLALSGARSSNCDDQFRSYMLALGVSFKLQDWSLVCNLID